MADELDRDKGRPFFAVRLVEHGHNVSPPQDADAIKSARSLTVREFRARTLPIPGSKDRLTADFTIGLDLPVQFIDGGEKASVLPEPEQAKSKEKQLAAVCDEEIGMTFASDLLGKYWYRHQEKNVFDSINLVHEIEEAETRGKSVASVLKEAGKPKPPSPGRRR